MQMRIHLRGIAMKAKHLVELGILVAIIFSVALSIISLSREAPDDVMRKGPYLIYPGNSSSMTVLWQTYDSQGTSTIEWGTPDDYNIGKAKVREKSDEEDGHQFSYTIDDLPTSSRIYYEVSVGNRSYPGSFTTAPAGLEAPLTFYAFGDSRTNPDMMDRVISRMMASINKTDSKTFCLHAGDYVTSGQREADWDSKYFNRAFKNTSNFLSMVPVMGCAGNHEEGGKLFRKYFQYPFKDKDCNYYSFDYGLIHVTALDQYATDYYKGSPQYSWLEQDLSNATMPWKIVLLHDPLWCATPPKSSDTDIMVYRIDLQPLFESKGVKAVIQGHRHYYSRCLVNGIEYITLGGGGAELYDPSMDVPYLEAVSKSHHFARFDVSVDEMKVRVTDDEGRLQDSFEIERQ
jgi:hypothetical protein